ncbi:LacI family DNA-binding transcriptional regulator [Agilicoccus flavus]|uniref:LacI family DNA-binding transcriptional regulator n=1 Tax=Agilicoccus flavus TaxID=2775968 RepID=UPI001CF6FE1E|nr:LacI family DNA-binding transcriptional regulator [Agilicoccus flavus]
MSTTSVKDVARAAGVSVGTVSNVLNRPDVVAEATRVRVLAAIDRLGFVRNEAARHLRSGSSRAIGLVVIDAGNPFFTDLARGVEDTVEGFGDSVLLGNSAEDPRREARYLELFEQQRVRGVLVTPTRGELPDLSGFERLDIPVVVLDRHLPAFAVSSVSVDDVAGGRLAAEHLAELGHRDTWFVGGPEGLQQVQDRLAGFTGGMRAAGGRTEHVPTTGLTVGAGREIGARLAALAPGAWPTAVFAANDLVAIGILNALVAEGRRIPEDLSIVGFDDIAFASTTTVPLTSIGQPAHAIGQAGAELLYAQLDAEPGRRPAARQVRFSPTLVVRESTGPAPRP